MPNKQEYIKQMEKFTKDLNNLDFPPEFDDFIKQVKQHLEQDIFGILNLDGFNRQEVN